MRAGPDQFSAMLPPHDDLERSEGAGTDNRSRPWLVRALVSVGIGFVVLLGWSAAASAAEGPWADGLTGSLPSTGTPVDGVIDAAEAVVAPVVVPVPSAPAVTAPSPVAPVVDQVTGSAPVLPVPSAPVAPPADLIPDAPVPSLPSAPAAPEAPIPTPSNPWSIPPAPELEPVIPPVGLPAPVDGIVPTDELPALPGAASPSAETAADPSAPRSAATGSTVSVAAADPAASIDAMLAVASDGDRPGLTGLPPASTPGADRPAHPIAPAPRTPIAGCGAGAPVDRAPSSGPSTALLRADDAASRARARALLDQEQAALASIARARPEVAPD